MSGGWFIISTVMFFTAFWEVVKACAYTIKFGSAVSGLIIIVILGILLFLAMVKWIKQLVRFAKGGEDTDNV
jgi:large-conductance mechanosensitive channel